MVPERTLDQREARLFALALEGTTSGSEYKYFKKIEALLSPRSKPRYKLKLIPTPRTPQDNNRSAPQHVFERLHEFCEKHQLDPVVDVRWLVFDTDMWESIDEILEKSHNERFRTAMSNPCFELWLLLHHETPDQVRAGAGVDETTNKPKRCRALKKRLGKIRDELSRRGSKVELDPERIHTAARRSRELLGPKPPTRRPPLPGTFVHEIIESLVELQLLPPPNEPAPPSPPPTSP